VLSVAFYLFFTINNNAYSDTEKTTIIIDLNSQSYPVKNHLFGNNIQWPDKGDHLLDDSNNRFNQSRLALIKKTKPTTLRFPGGLHADVYHWREGVGERTKRIPGKHYFSAQKVPSLFGTDEFLKLCKILDCQPIITVNIATGTPQEAANWVVYVNKMVKKVGCPEVLFWEIGNEQYLNNKEIRLTPVEYQKKYLSFASAIKKVDKEIKLGALVVDRGTDGVFENAYSQSWNRTILSKKNSSLIDYLCIHNAYAPGPIPAVKGDKKKLFKTVFKTVDRIEEDYQYLQKLWKGISPKPVKIALTEYNTFLVLKSPIAVILLLWGAVSISPSFCICLLSHPLLPQQTTGL
ncbi:MAG: hypothetical protein HQL32_11955, partial [Planctomycetes bacterium]|nr:hypothetical protein [Planctomycetota bacterium]